MLDAVPEATPRWEWSAGLYLEKRAVFGENDPARRRAAIDEIFTEDCVFYDPTKGVYRGRDEIDRVAD